MRGVIGYRALRAREPGARRAPGHLRLRRRRRTSTAQSALAEGATVHVLTRSSRRARELALELGSRERGDAADAPPSRSTRPILFAPVGDLVTVALARARRGGTLAVGRAST